MIEPIDTDYITQFMYTEASQEDGLEQNEIDIIPTVWYEDLLSPHYEMGMTGKTTLNTVDFLRRAAENQALHRGRHHFAERVMVLTPEELEKMFTEVQVPWPSTHALTMMGTLQQAYIQQGMSPEVAQAKLQEVQSKWFENNQRINARIRHYYDGLPDALIRNRQRASNITDLGYDPRVFASDQGIRPLDVEMREAGIGDTTERFLQEAGLSTH